jgi:hypothetical protein
MPSLYALPGPTILAGQSLSDGVDCTGSRILRIVVPPQWTAAPISFQLSPDNNIYGDMYHVTGTFSTYEVVVAPIIAGSVIVLPVGTGDGIAFVKIRSGTHAAPVKQAVDCVFTVVLLVPDPPAARNAPEKELRKS